MEKTYKYIMERSLYAKVIQCHVVTTLGYRENRKIHHGAIGRPARYRSVFIPDPWLFSRPLW